MILMRKPVVVYDVDLIGVVAVLVLCVITSTAVIVPSLASADSQRESNSAGTMKQNSLDHAEQQLLTVIAENKQLTEAVQQRRADLPQGTSSETFLEMLSELGKKTGVRLSQVAPAAPTIIQGRRAADVVVAATGDARNLLAFLVELRRTDAYHVLLEYAIVRGTDPSQTSQLNCTIRRFLADTEGSNP